jgi:hypothetical protein
MRGSEQRFAYLLNWVELPKEARQPNEKWAVDVSTDYPELLKKLGGGPRRFLGPTRDLALAEARGFVDSISLT